MNEEDTKKVTTPINPDTIQRNQPCLVVVSGFEMGRRYPLARSEIIIGRGLKSHIALKEKNVSRRHARIVIKDDDYIIEDLQSKNKTLINGKKITSQVLKEGDLIVIGNIILKFSIQSEVDKNFCDEVYEAKYDELTGLISRKFFQKYITSELVRADRYGHVVSLLLCDLDDFKQINDQYGHHVGDLVLHLIGQAIATCIRKDLDIPVRYGGEEFAILLPETSLESAKIVGEKIRSYIENLRIAYDEVTITVTTSIGVSSSSEGISTPDDFLRKVDEKLYTAKQRGKNRVEI